VLVEFDEGNTPGFAYFTDSGRALRILGRRADLKTRTSSVNTFRDEVLAEAEELYVEAR